MKPRLVPSRFVVLLFAVQLALPSASARAQGASDKAAAEALFQQGRKLFDAGQYPAACAKFAESQRLDPAPGTLLNLGGCYEKNGQTASAWATFTQAISASHQRGRADWEDLARTRASALEPKLSRLTIAVAVPAIDGLHVKRDGVDVGSAEWGTPIPVDPGSHVVDAEAPHRAPFHQSVSVPATGGNVTLSVPDLDPQAGDGGDKTGDHSGGSGSSQRVVGLAVAGVGVAGIAIGSAFGLVAMNKENDALHNHCTQDKYCDSQGVQLGQDAHSAATASTIAFAVGGVALAGGLAIYFLAPQSKTEGKSVGKTDAPTVGLRAAATPGGTTLDIVGAW
jgi:hypothetical protein